MSLSAPHVYRSGVRKVFAQALTEFWEAVMRARVIRARVVLILTTLGLALALTASPVAAANGSFEVQGVGGGFFSMSGSGVWFANPTCYTGHVEDPDLPLDFRFALEFPVTGLPADATITSATLSLHTPADDEAFQTVVYGYAGNGSVEPADVAVTGTPVNVHAHDEQRPRGPRRDGPRDA